MKFFFISNFHGYVYICGIDTWASIDFPLVVILINNNISPNTDDKFSMDHAFITIYWFASLCGQLWDYTDTVPYRFLDNI